MVTRPDSNKTRQKRHVGIRAKISGTSQRPRLSVFRSTKHIYAQLIDDVTGTTLASASTMQDTVEGGKSNKQAAHQIGVALAKKAAEKGISEVVFDRSGYIYHGRVKELAEGAREGGLKF